VQRDDPAEERPAPAPTFTWFVVTIEEDGVGEAFVEAAAADADVCAPALATTARDCDPLAPCLTLEGSGTQNSSCGSISDKTSGAMKAHVPQNVGRLRSVEETDVPRRGCDCWCVC
jgi:hypothetical protein